MSAGLTPEEVLSRIPGWSDAQVTRQIHGGLSNRSFVVHSGGRDFMLSLDAEHTKMFGLDRRAALEVHREAAKKLLAPEVIFADPDAGVLLCEYLPGPVWDRASLDDPGNLDRLAALLREVHSLPVSGVALDAAAAAERYAATASRNSDLRPFAARCVEIVREIPAAGPLACCHNDVVAANVIETPGLRLLDWEYASDNDPFFDLASPLAYHHLGRKQRDLLIDAYTGGSDPEAQERLDLQIRVFDVLQWLWFAARSVISPNASDRSTLEAIARRIARRP